MIPNRQSIITFFFVILSVTSAAQGEELDWRARQRAELATLPKPPSPPDGEGNAIDRFLAEHWQSSGFEPAPRVDDAHFARRVYLDTIGLPPTEDQLKAFVEDNHPAKYQRLVESLLARNDDFAEHWMTYWNDLLRNDEQTNIDGLRKPITPWLYESLRANKPLDVFVAELLDPGAKGPDGYLKGVNWRGRVNASQRPPIQAAQNVAQVFQATAIKCASCHDSFINLWSLEEAYGLASFFAAEDLEMHRCDQATGKVITPSFLFPELGSIPAKATQAQRHEAVAKMVTRPKNPRFAKSMVNRLWKQLLGRGLFEPADDFDNATIEHEALLDWLAYDFMAHDYDVKHTLRLIMTSRVYALPVYTPPDKEALTALNGPLERRLSAEQFLDSISHATGYWPKKLPVMNVKVDNPHIRAWRHKKPNELVTALGRPTREQVTTEREQEPTVLQSLELVNGDVLANWLKEGAKTLMESPLGKEANQEKIVRSLFLRFLGREPTKDEMELFREQLGDSDERGEAWEDVLWVLAMQPEFQYIR